MGRWQTQYDKKHRPRQQELAGHLPPEVMALFFSFSNHLARVYGLSCAPATYSVEHGWVFRFGRTGMYLISGVWIDDFAFWVDGICVSDNSSLQEAIAYADAHYADGFAERFAAITAEKAAKQAASTKRRIAREQAELDALSAQIIPGQFNQYAWMPKVSRQKLKRLYERDAQGLPDGALADDIGFTLYARCMQGQEERLLIESGKLRCHGCGAILPATRSLMTCACGRQYLFRDYMRSFRKNNMPSGSATDIFNTFTANWPKATTYALKMQLIDGLVHEFHINLITGVKGRFVGINLIEGTKKQIADLILSLAYSGDAPATHEAFKRNLERL